MAGIYATAVPNDSSIHNVVTNASTVTFNSISSTPHNRRRRASASSNRYQAIRRWWWHQTHIQESSGSQIKSWEGRKWSLLRNKLVDPQACGGSEALAPSCRDPSYPIVGTIHSTTCRALQPPGPTNALMLAAGQSACIALMGGFKVCSGSGKSITPSTSSQSANSMPHKCAPLTMALSSILSNVEHSSPPVLVLSALAYGALAAMQYAVYRTDRLQRTFLFIGLALGVLAWSPQLAEPEGQQDVLLSVFLMLTIALTSSALSHWLYRALHGFKDTEGTISRDEDKTPVHFVRHEKSLVDTVV